MKVRAISFSIDWVRQFSLFILGGILSALVDLVVTSILLALGCWYITSISVGFFVGLCVNFLYNSKVTFVVALSKFIFAKYLVIVAANYLLTLIIVAFFHQGMGGSVLLGKVISLPIIAFHSYFWGRIWIFKASSAVD